ncbi:hypothetical protein GCM10027286_20830 [Virgibacillus ainsalahensis]
MNDFFLNVKGSMFVELKCKTIEYSFVVMLKWIIIYGKLVIDEIGGLRCGRK